MDARRPAVLRSAIDRQRETQAPHRRRAVVLERGDVRPQARQQQRHELAVRHDLGGDAAITQVKLAREIVVRQMGQRRIGIRQVRRAPSRHEKMQRLRTAFAHEGSTQLGCDHRTHAVPEDRERHIEMGTQLGKQRIHDVRNSIEGLLAQACLAARQLNGADARPPPAAPQPSNR